MDCPRKLKHLILPYYGGLFPKQLVTTLRLFVKCILHDIYKHDSADLVR